MATSKVEIANRALAKIQASSIQNFTENTVESRAATLVYDESRRYVLRRGQWSWAIGRAQLARQSAAPAFGFDYAYAKPADWLRFIDMFTDLSGTTLLSDYQIESDGVVCNSEAVYATYVKDVTDPNLMTTDFRAALEDYMASQLALKLPGSKSLADVMLDRFERISLPRGLSVEGVDGGLEFMPETTWYTGREGG